MSKPSLVVFSDDWRRHPSSCQHLVERLLPRYEVLWVNTIGTRAPRFDRATMSRALSKARQWVLGGLNSVEQPATSGPRIHSPLMWPWFRRPVDRWLNQRLLCRSLAPAIAELPRPRIAVTTIPLVSDLIGRLDVDRWIYYCVDDLASWPGLDGESLRLMEQTLVARADRCVSVSDHLQEHLKSQGQDSTLLTHGVDLDFWRNGTTSVKAGQILPDVAHPWVVFWGLIDERLNVDWILELADRLTAGTIVLAGPIQVADPQIRRHPRILLPGAIPYQTLPQLAQKASVLVMPYRDLPATRAMQPLKLKEYLATGLPCVVSPIPAVDDWSDSLDVAADADEFSSAVLNRLTDGIPASQLAARLRLEEEDWTQKADQFSRLLESNATCTTIQQPTPA